MSTPASFKLDPVKDAGNWTPKPPQQLKNQIYQDLSFFSDVDEHAISEARANYPTFRDLIWNLVFKKDLNELQKARVIFRWMTCKELQTISFDNVKPGSEEQLLMAFKSGKATYARIFETMAKVAGLACVTLTGWAKGVDYRPGVAISKRPVNHSWNAVLIDGNWQLIDSHWATRFLQSDTDLNPDNLVYEYDDFYFLSEPAQLTYTHRPEDSSWQLLDSPQTADEFEDYPLVKSYFFTNAMFFPPNQNRGVIKTKKGIAALPVGFSKKTTFTYKLVYGDEMMDVINGVELNRYVIQDIRDNDVMYYVRLPCRGEFYLIVFAHLFIDPIKSPENVFKAVVEYQFVAGSDVPKDVAPFPACSDMNWGPDAALAQYGLTPRNKDALLLAPKGHAEVVFDKGNPDTRLYARLVKDGVPVTDVKNAVAVSNESDKASVVLELPLKGEYGLEIFANNPQKDGDMFTHVSQYLCCYIDGNISDVYGNPSHHVPPVKEKQVKLGVYDSATGVTVESIVPQHSVEPEAEHVPDSPEKYITPLETIQPPENYVLSQPVTLDELAADEAELKPEVFATRKPFKDLTVFEHVDSHVLEVAKLEHVSFRDIIWHLIFARQMKNQLDIARALFLWLCTKDL